MFSQACVIPSVHWGGGSASGFGGGGVPLALGVCLWVQGSVPPGHTPPGLTPPRHNGQQAGGTHPTGQIIG